jgi:hypothetical protein
MKKQFYRWCIILLCIINLGATADSDWDTKLENKNVKLQYRWVKSEDNAEYREFRAILKMSATVTSFMKNMNEAQKLAQWTAKSKDCKIYSKTENSWITYTLFDIPKPFKRQDLVLKHTVSYKNNRLIINLESLPNYVPEQRDVTRLTEYIGHWEVIQEKPNQLKVQFYYASLEKPVLPRFIIDPILQKILMESFMKLIDLSEAD